MRAGSTSTPRKQASFNVAASGCAPPMPPMPPETIRRFFSDPPKCLFAAAANVSKVPCTIPWLAVLDPGPALNLPIHDEPELLQPMKLLVVGPAADQVRVGDQHARRF